MKDIFILLVALGVIYAAAAAGNWIGIHAPWIGDFGVLALVIIGMAKLYRRGWGGNHDENM